MTSPCHKRRDHTKPLYGGFLRRNKRKKRQRKRSTTTTTRTATGTGTTTRNIRQVQLYDGDDFCFCCYFCNYHSFCTVSSSSSPNPRFRNAVYVRTLGSNSFSFEVQLQVQLQFKKFGVEFNLEFNLKFEPGVRRELRCSNSGFEASNSKFGVPEPWVWNSKIIEKGGPWGYLFCCRKRLNFAPKRPLRAQRKKVEVFLKGEKRLNFASKLSLRFSTTLFS